MDEKVKVGSVVHILYKGGVKGEEPVDDRSTGEPLVVMIGDLKLPKGIEEALIGMVPGEEKQVQIEAADGYGEYHEELAQWYPRQMLDQGYTLKVGDVMFYNNHDTNQRQPGFVTEVTDDTVKVDFNHPFAGKTLDYWLKLVKVGWKEQELNMDKNEKELEAIDEAYEAREQDNMGVLGDAGEAAEAAVEFAEAEEE